MKKNYTVIKNNFIRILNKDICGFGLKKHHFKILSEIDVTKIKDYCNAKKSQGIDISFTAILIKLISNAIKYNNRVHSFNIRKSKLKAFNDVDVELQVEKAIGEENIPLGLLIRNSNTKNIDEIAKEIKDFKNKPAIIDSYIKLFCCLPSFLRNLIWNMIINNYNLIKKYFGTVSITSLGMMGDFNGWIVPISIQQLCIGIGSLINNDGKYILKMTFLFDHDVIDGADAVRFISCFKKEIINL